MKISGECANLELDTLSVLSGAGIQEISLMVYFNIDMRQVLGDMYDRYEEFLMVFDGIGGWTNATSFTTTPSNLSTNNLISGGNQTSSWSLGMTGLDWKYSTYNGQLNEIALFPNKFNLGVSGFTTSNFGSTSQGIVFRKPSNPFVRLSVAPYLSRTQGIGVAVTTATAIQIDFNYNFSIYGLSEEK